jgi:hypothetical protein
MLRTLLIFGIAAALAPAELLRVELVERADVADGRAFGAAGPYERIRARAHFAVDPAHAANRDIADIALAAPNEAGRVEFSSDLSVLKPRDPAKGNHIVLFEAPNRGGRGLMGVFNRARASGGEFGDGLLLEQGYTLVWVGWQHDVPDRAGALRLHAPVAKGVEGWVRSEFSASSRADGFPLADSNHIAYPVADAAKARVTVRDGMSGLRSELPPQKWSIEGGMVKVAGGLEPGRIYEIIYPSRDPALAGLGMAAIRDTISFLRYGRNNVTLLGDQRRHIKHTLAYGSSQSGMALRALLLGGFNADEAGRRVFDGIWAHIAGGRRSSFHRFAQPSRTAGPHRNSTFSRTDTFPFTDAQTRDAETQARGGLLERYSSETVPKIFYTNSAYEYWGSGASLIHTTPDGREDVAPPATARIYLMAGGQHGPAGFPPQADGTRYAPNPNAYTVTLRALLEAMRRWVVEGVEPPASVYPRLADGTLTAFEGWKFPRIPGVDAPKGLHAFVRADYATEPPRAGKPFVTLVPQVDADGNDLGGIRTPELTHPLATYTGWNLRDAKIGAAGDLAANLGSYLPFARTKAEREATGDPRRSIEERYESGEKYAGLIRAAAMEMVKQRLLLERDVELVVKAAEARWRWHQPQVQSRR